MKYLVTLFISQLLFIYLFAQVDREEQNDGGVPEIIVNQNRIYGKILDAKTSKGIESASVQLIAIEKNKESGERSERLADAMLTKANGDFSFEKMPEADSVLLVISVTGYKTIIKEIALKDINEGDNRQRGRSVVNKDLGNLMMEEDIQQLGAVTVIAQRPGLQMGIDRKIFNVEQSLVSTGGTGLDVMRNIPSVTVDIDGNVLLRNSSPQIYVDGRPTILTIDQIPADNIERVELITNPSAKFDASSGAGIINIILKKNKRVGLNGIIAGGIGSPESRNANANLSMREGKINFFISGSYNYSTGDATSRTLRQNKKAGVIENYFNQYTDNSRLRDNRSLRFGFDYFLDNRNTLTVTQHIFRGKRGNEDTQDQEYLDVNQDPEYFGYRYSDNLRNFKRNTSRITFTHKFPKEGKELNANLNYNYGSGDEYSNILNTFTNPDGTEYSLPATIKDDGTNNSDQWTFEIDYTNPISDDKKLEAGFRSYINDYRSIFNAYSVDNSGIETKLSLSNNYKYKEMVNAAYVTWTGSFNTIKYQAGLRAEHSKFDGELIDSARKFGYVYPNQLNKVWDALFPSLFVTKSISEDVEVQVNYSRRIRRPNFWQLNPFIDINDPVNLRRGNPELKPEFINSFEFNYSHNFGKGNNFLGVIYYRNNPGDITRYSDTITDAQYQQLNNAAVDPNAILNTFINAQATNRLGAEFTLQQKFGDNFDVTPSIDLQYRKVKAKFKDLDLNNDGFNWEGKLILNYKFGPQANSVWKNLSFQLLGEYESSEVTAQGRRSPEYSVDFALRKDFLKNKKANFTFSINDVFNTKRFGSIYDTEYFYQDSYWRRNVRGFRITLSYKFGDAEFSLRRNRGGNGGGNDDD